MPASRPSSTSPVSLCRKGLAASTSSENREGSAVPPPRRITLQLTPVTLAISNVLPANRAGARQNRRDKMADILHRQHLHSPSGNIKLKTTFIKAKTGHHQQLHKGGGPHDGRRQRQAANMPFNFRFGVIMRYAGRRLPSRCRSCTPDASPRTRRRDRRWLSRSVPPAHRSPSLPANWAGR